MSVNTAVVLPLVGRIAAGQPIEAVQSNETISLADFVRSKEVFVLEVRGDSMQTSTSSMAITCWWKKPAPRTTAILSWRWWIQPMPR